jgi:hypothetical protein
MDRRRGFPAQWNRPMILSKPVLFLGGPDSHFFLRRPAVHHPFVLCQILAQKTASDSSATGCVKNEKANLL